MSEALYLPVAVVACWALARCLCEPTVARQAALLGAVGLALATRLQAIGLRSHHRCRATRPRRGRALDGDGCGACFRLSRSSQEPRLAWIGVRIATGGLGGSVGAYAPLAQAAHYSLRDIGSSIAQQAGAVALLTFGIPLVGLGLLTWTTLRGREPDRGVRALVATTVAYLGVTVLEVGAFASRFVEHLTERQLLSVAPPVFIAFAVWLHRGLPRPQPATSVIALAVAASALLLPVRRASRRRRQRSTRSRRSRSSTFVASSRRRASRPSTQSWRRSSCCSRSSFPDVSGRVLAGIVAVALARRARSSPRARSGSDPRPSARTRSPGAPPTWMDENEAHDVGMLVTGELLWPGVWHQLFWNSSIAGVVHLHGAALPGAAPQEEVSVAAGRLAASSLRSARRVPASSRRRRRSPSRGRPSGPSGPRPISRE